MADPSKAADDAIYNDDASGYAYDQYQTENQWLYDDNQAPVKPDSDAQQLQQQQQPQPQYSELPITSMGGGGMGASNNDTSYTASDNKDAGKLFVGGLSWETDENRLREYFSKFGPIMDCSIMRDQVSGRPRGFGFVTFVDVASVDAVLQEPSHRLDGKHIDPKHAIPREQQPGAHHAHPHNGNLGGNNDTFADPIGEMRGEKIFVGGLPPSATDADLNSTFSVYGTITETKLMIDRETGRSRGYGFLQFENESSALESVKVGNSVGGIMIHGKRVDVKPAVHKKRNPMPGMVQGGYNMMGYNMMGYNMMGMPGYNMMGMPGYNMMPGANGQQPMSPQHQSQQSASATAVSPGGTGAMDYTAMGYPGYYGNMAGYYDGADGGNPADQTAMMNYYAQMGGYYPTEGQADGQTDAAAANNGQTDYQDSNQYDPAVKQESKS
ncbi:Heteroproteinous nuclear ribonucleoprotein A1, partial [Linderina macrospora]